LADITIADEVQVSPVQVIEQGIAPAGVALEAGQLVRKDPDTGALLLSDATDADTAIVDGISITTCAAGFGATYVKKGIVDVGLASLDGLDFDSLIYLSNTAGALSTTAGAQSVVVGRVEAGFSSRPADRLLRINV
jgi:hypothetical protein